MSRIEEALRRVRSDGAEAAVAVEEPGRTPDHTQGLARFPAEHGRAVEREPRRVRMASVSDDSPRWRDQRAFPSVLEGKLILKRAPAVAVEQYRRLAAALHALQAEHGTRTLMVTSALPQEGKTLTVTNLALTLSESYGRRVLLIDADLRRPSIHELFGLSNARGLSDGLRAEGGELPLLTVTPRLSVLPAGRVDRNPMAGLTSDRMRAVLQEAAAAFDWVLLDAPPVGIMPDAHLLAQLTEGVLFVIAAGTTPFHLVERALADIGRDTIIGTVLNRIDSGSIPATSYYEHYYAGATSSE